MNTTYHELFDTQYDCERLINKLKYTTPAYYDELYINEEDAEIHLAFGAFFYEWRRSHGWEDEEYDEYHAHTNHTLVENIANRFEFTRFSLYEYYFGE